MIAAEREGNRTRDASDEVREPAVLREIAEPAPFDGPDAISGRAATILASLRHHRRAVISVLLVVLAGTLIAYALIPRLFTARADVWLDHGFERLGPATAATAAASNSPLARNTELRLLTSTDLAAGVVDRLGLDNVRGFGQPTNGPLVPRAAARRVAIGRVLDNLAIETNGTSYAVAVRYTAADPVLATALVNNLVDSYAADRRSGGLRGRERAAMQAQVATAREESISSQAAVRGYRAAFELVRKGDDGASTRAEIASLDQAIKAASADQNAADARLREAQGGTTEQTITSPRIRDLRARQAQLTGARGGQPADEAGNAARLADLNRALAAETRRVTKLADAAAAARSRTQLLRSARGRANAELRAAGAAAAQLKRIDARASAAQARYADVALRYTRLVSAQRRDPGTAYVISRGAVRSARSFPDPLLFGVGGTVVALILAAATVLLLEALTKGFRSRRQVEHKLGLPVIGMVPDLAKIRDADFPADDAMGPADYLYNNRHSPFSASFRAIHTGLRLGLTGKSLRSIAICSALQEEGKTTVALCLARSAALAGLRVILVDCDGRRPVASRALSPYVRTGLAHVLEDGVEFRTAIQCDTPSGAWFLAQSSDRAVAPSSVASSRMAALIRQLEQSYDLVLLDTAPILALAESRELAAMANGVVLVARARKTPVQATRIAQEMLEKAGARIVGATLTRVDPW